MAKQNNKEVQTSTAEDNNLDEYDEMEILEILESVREDMEELGVTTLAEVIQRIDELHQKLDRK